MHELLNKIISYSLIIYFQLMKMTVAIAKKKEKIDSSHFISRKYVLKNVSIFQTLSELNRLFYFIYRLLILTRITEIYNVFLTIKILIKKLLETGTMRPLKIIYFQAHIRKL